MEAFLKIKKEDVEDVLPLAMMQEGFLYQYMRASFKGNFEQFCYRLRGNINLAALTLAWNAVVASNEMLRTVFRWENIHQPIQIVLKDRPPTINHYDLTSKKQEDCQRAVMELREKDLLAPIDIREESIRVSLCLLNQSECEMIVSCNIIILDGWSNGITLKELLDNYHQIVKGIKVEKKVKTDYKNFIKWMGELDHCSQDDYWRTYLHGFAKPSPLPFLNNGPEEIPVKEEGFCTFPVEDSFSKRVFEFVKMKQITLASLMYTVWSILLYLYTGEKDIVYGITVSGRASELKGIENMVGVFINSLPFRIQIKNEEAVDSLLKRTKNKTTEMEGYSYISPVNLKSLAKLTPRNALFHSLIVVQNYPLSEELFHGNDEVSIQLEEALSAGNSNLYMGITYWNRLQIMIHYNSEIYNKKQIDQIWDTFKRILMQILDASDLQKSGVRELQIGDFDRMEESEKNMVISHIHKAKSMFEKLEEADFDDLF